MKPRFDVEDEAWWAKTGVSAVTKTCPVCYGEREVTLILGNGDRVRLPCSYCGTGFDAPRGFVTEHDYVAEPQMVIITGVTSYDNGEAVEYEYRVGAYVPKGDDLFDNRDDALSRCQEIAERRKRDEEKKVEYIKYDKKKSFAWNAGYHMRCVKKAHKDIEYHERMAVICKAKDKTKEGN